MACLLNLLSVCNSLNQNSSHKRITPFNPRVTPVLLHRTIRKTTKRKYLNATITVGPMAHVGTQAGKTKANPTIIKQQQPSTACLVAQKQGVFGCNLYGAYG